MARYLRLADLAPVNLLLHGVEHAIVVVVYHVALANDFLPGHHHSARRRYARQQVVACRLRAVAVEYEVGHYVVVHVEPLHQQPLFGEIAVVQQQLIGRHGGIDEAHLPRLRVLAEDHPYLRRGVVVERIVLRCPHDARLVELVQLFYQGLRESRRQRAGLCQFDPQLGRLHRLHAVVVVVVRLEGM